MKKEMQRVDFRLMQDVSRCANKDCPLKTECKRWLDNPPYDLYLDMYSVSDIKYNRDGTCDYIIRVGK